MATTRRQRHGRAPRSSRTRTDGTTRARGGGETFRPDERFLIGSGLAERRAGLARVLARHGQEPWLLTPAIGVLLLLFRLHWAAPGRRPRTPAPAGESAARPRRPVAAEFAWRLGVTGPHVARRTRSVVPAGWRAPRFLAPFSGPARARSGSSGAGVMLLPLTAFSDSIRATGIARSHHNACRTWAAGDS